MRVEIPAGQGTSSKPVIHALWMSSGLSCDGESVAITAATSPSLEDIIRGVIPGMPKVVIHHPLLAYENGQEFLQAWLDAEQGQLEPFILLVEGSIPNERINGEGYWSGLGADPNTGQPITTNEWVDRLAPKAEAVVAVGTCATYGGVPAMKNNPTGAMGLPDYLGWQWRSKADVPIVCIPGCPSQPDNITEVILYLSLMLAGMAPQIDLDDALRPRWLFQRTVHEGCNRAAFYENGSFADSYGSEKCLIKLGCKGPVVKCNVATRGWIRGKGGCPNVGGICIGCTMPGFPDRFLPFMETSYVVKASLSLPKFTYGPILRTLRKQAMKRSSKEPEWRTPSPSLKSGYEPAWAVGKEQPPLEYERYTVGGREARVYSFDPGEQVRAEVDGATIFLSWSSTLDAGDWLEALQEEVNPESALGLVIFADEPDLRGDLTWRETQALIEEPSRNPFFVRIDLGSMALLWHANESGERLSRIQYSAPFFDEALIRVLMLASASPAIRDKLGQLLSELQLAKYWGLKTGTS